ncbi:transposase family protein [Rhodococcus aetherivorans]|uniref:transposase family protein n=1 Tax=Rhodococcus aetherivorans TaxID=191292 RepID=UPI0036994756
MPVPVSDTGILEVLDQVPDPRARRGVRHRLAAILAVALSAVCAGGALVHPRVGSRFRDE